MQLDKQRRRQQELEWATAKEKEVGSADISSSSNFIVDELVNNPPCEQGYSNPDGEVGEVARFADNPDDLEAIWNWNWNNFDSA